MEKNVVFLTAFHQKEAIEMLFLLLESLYIFGNLNETMDILVYTSTDYKNLIEKSNLFIPEKICIYTCDKYDSIESACKARLDIFDIPIVNNYARVLYLDIDILVKGDLHPIFDVITNDGILYSIEEGHCNENYYGGDFIKDEKERAKSSKTAFTSGIMGFKVSSQVQGLFQTIKEHMKRDPRKFDVHDQPYIVYNAFICDMFDNQKMNSLAINRPSSVDTPHVILHYCGGPGLFKRKVDVMKSSLNILKEQLLDKIDRQVKDVIVDGLLPIIQELSEPLEGNIYMQHHQLEFSDMYKPKRQNLVNILSMLSHRPINILEIGFNAGFSALLMLLCNPHATITCLDICEHTYTVPCFNVLKKMFGSRIHLVQGSSMETLPLVEGDFDIIHVDGGHGDVVVENDCKHTMRLARKRTIIIMDDYDFQNIHRIWNTYIAEHTHLVSLSSQIDSTHMQDIRFLW